MYSPLISWSRYILLASLALALVFVLPFAWFPFQLGKLAIFVFLLTVCVLFFVLGRGGRELLRAHGFSLAALVAVLPLAYAFSTLLSTDRSLALLGYGVETDTLVFTTLAAVVFLLSFGLFRTLRTVKILLSVVFWALAAAAVFQFIHITVGLPFEAFADRTVNLIGKWNDLGLLMGLLTVFLIARAEFGYIPLWRRALIGISAAAIMVLLGIINFALAWGLVLAFSVVIALVALVIQKMPRENEAASSSVDMIERVPWFALAGILVSVVFLFFGSTINTGLTRVFPVSSLEVRPAYSSTLDIINAARDGSVPRIFVGTGPNTFGQSWLMHKPLEVNQTLFWNLDFNVGFSALMTALGSVGFLGLISWLIPLLLVLVGFVRVVRLGILSREERVAAVMIGTGSIFLVAALILYVPSQNLILLAFALSGATFGFLWRQGRSRDIEEESPSRLSDVGAVGISLLLLALAFFSMFVVDRRFLAQAYIGAAAFALQSGNSDLAIERLNIAQGIENTSEALRLMTDTGNIKIQLLAQDNTTPAAQIQQEFSALAGQAVGAGQAAVTSAPSDYRSHLTLARLYDFLATLGVQGAYESAKETYSTARTLAPHNPQIPLLLARLEGAQGNLEAAEEYLTASLTLKPNYTDAILFAVQLSVARNDIPNAIRAATAAVQTAPGVAPIWFQLGLLYYVAGDSTNAALALEQALALVPDYANAKYFLGLAYYTQGKSVEAIALFQDLAQTNPDNAEVALILSNMAAGRDPFENATPPFVPPEEREKAPISQ